MSVENQDYNIGLIKEVRDRIQFLIMIGIFFSTFIYTFYKAIGSNEVIANTNALFWGLGVAFCIINYLLVGTVQDIKRKVLTWVRGSISINIALFILPTILLFLLVKNPISEYFAWPFVISLYGCVLMPFITFLLLLGIMYWQEFRWYLEKWMMKNKTRQKGNFHFKELL